MLSRDRLPRRFGLLASAALLTASASAQELQPIPGSPVSGLTAAELALFEDGREAFGTPLTPADGLGPIFNDVSCASCHNVPEIGGFGTSKVIRFGIAAAGGNPFDPLANAGGSLLQEQSIDPANCMEVVPANATVTSERATPICFGLGLIEAIPDSEILANAANQPAGYGGVPHMVQPIEDPSGPQRVGKMGWKGGISTVQSFSLDAGLNEMGLTSSFLMTENAPNGDLAALAACDNVPDPEDPMAPNGLLFTERLTNFQRLLAAPPQMPQTGMSGEQHFDAIGCAVCHRPEYVTGAAPEAGLSGQTIRPYSDFLLHDMGALGDGIVEGTASETWMMTRSLWGMALRSDLLHDGRATGSFDGRVRAAIDEHDGEGAASRAAFGNLTPAEQDELVAFLASLGRRPFDIDTTQGVGVDEFDWFFLEPLLNGPAPATLYSPDDSGALADLDADGDFDLVEFGLFQRAFEGQSTAAAVSELNLTLTSNGQSQITVQPGASIDYALTGELSNGQSQGLAMFAIDLAFDGGALSPATAPANGATAEFVSPMGVNNPAGYGGTSAGSELLQLGGAMNTINNSFAPVPNGTVATGLGLPGAALLLAEGQLIAPTAPGTYTLRVTSAFANVLRSGSTGFPAWEVDATETGATVDLVIQVGDCIVTEYCEGKQNSVGCKPVLSWTGTPSVAGADDFVVYARGLVPGELTIAVTGQNSANMPFFGGTLCIQGGLTRLPQTQANSLPGCSSRADIPISQAWMSAQGWTVGTDVYLQVWQRDPANPDGTGVGLSNAIQFQVCP